MKRGSHCVKLFFQRITEMKQGEDVWKNVYFFFNAFAMNGS